METRTVDLTIPADPANLDSEAKVGTTPGPSSPSSPKLGPGLGPGLRGPRMNLLLYIVFYIHFVYIVFYTLSSNRLFPHVVIYLYVLYLYLV